jgi:hypothetical protein
MFLPSFFPPHQFYKFSFDNFYIRAFLHFLECPSRFLIPSDKVNFISVSLSHKHNSSIHFIISSNNTRVIESFSILLIFIFYPTVKPFFILSNKNFSFLKMSTLEARSRAFPIFLRTTPFSIESFLFFLLPLDKIELLYRARLYVNIHYQHSFQTKNFYYIEPPQFSSN